MWRAFKLLLLLICWLVFLATAGAWAYSYRTLHSFARERDAKVIEGFEASRGSLMLFRYSPSKPGVVYVKYPLGHRSRPPSEINPLVPLPIHNSRFVKTSEPGWLDSLVYGMSPRWSRAGFVYAEGKSLAVRQQHLRIPLAVLTAITGLIPLLSIGRFIATRRRRKPGFCPSCNYDLRAHTAPGDRCPECGHPTPATQPAPASPAA